MKKITFTITTIFSALLISCSGSDGRDGINGIDGKDGVDGADANLTIAIFEIAPDFEINANANYYETPYEFFPNGESIENDDVVLAYRLEFIASDGTDVWRQLPQPYFSDQGTLYYNFDYAIDGFTIYLEADFDISTLQQTSLVEDQIFRVVIIPSEMIGLSSKTDLSDLSVVMHSFGIDQNNLQRLD